MPFIFFLALGCFFYLRSNFSMMLFFHIARNKTKGFTLAREVYLFDHWTTILSPAMMHFGVYFLLCIGLQIIFYLDFEVQLLHHYWEILCHNFRYWFKCILCIYQILNNPFIVFFFSEISDSLSLDPVLINSLDVIYKKIIFIYITFYLKTKFYLWLIWTHLFIFSTNSLKKWYLLWLIYQGCPFYGH